MSNDTSEPSSPEQSDSPDPVDAIEAEERWHEVIDLSDFIGHSGKSLGKVAVVVLKKREDWKAQRNAHAEHEVLADELTQGRDTFKEDSLVLDDVKDAFAVYEALRRHDNPDAHAFPAPQWLVDHLDNEQLGTLARVCNQARMRKAGIPYAFTPQIVRDLRGAIVEHDNQSLPGEWPLAHFNRMQLDVFLVEAMKQWGRDLEELARLRAEKADDSE